MSGVCQITGKKTITVNHVSHSNRKVKSKSKANVKFKNLDLEFVEESIILKISNNGMKSLDIKNGLARYLLSKTRRELSPFLNKLRKIVIYFFLQKDFSSNPTLQKVQDLLKNSKSGRKFPSKLCRLKKIKDILPQ
jgi:large subunit ribosomal protein L28